MEHDSSERDSKSAQAVDTELEAGVVLVGSDGEGKVESVDGGFSYLTGWRLHAVTMGYVCPLSKVSFQHWTLKSEDL